jgi:hypothetical protein
METGVIFVLERPLVQPFPLFIASWDRKTVSGGVNPLDFLEIG